MAEIELKSDTVHSMYVATSRLTSVLEEPISLELDNVSGRVVPEYGAAGERSRSTKRGSLKNQEVKLGN